jgi:hypothetical protein
MKQDEGTVSWVVYKMTLHGKTEQVSAVCTQGEWEAMELSRPGYHTLVQAGITDENEAEKMARGTAGDSIPRSAARKNSPRGEVKA